MTRLLSTLLSTAFLSAGCTAGLHPERTALDPDTIRFDAALVANAPSDLPVTANGAPSAWPRQDWWTSYGDEQLDRLIGAALDGNPGLRVAEARVRQAQAMAEVSAAGLLPTLRLDDTAARQRYTANGLVPKPVAGNWYWSNQLALNFTYDFDFWGKHRAEVAAAVGQAQATRAELANARLVLAVAVIRAYLQLDDACRQRDIVAREVEERRRILSLTLQRVRAQIDSQVEARQAEAAVPAALARQTALDATLALRRNQLAALMGRGPDAGIGIGKPNLQPLTPATAPTLVTADLIGRRPDVIAQRWRVEAAAQQIEVAKASFYPDISLSAFIGYQSLNVTDFIKAGSRITGIAPAMTLPLFEGGRLRGYLAAQDAAYDMAVEDYNQTVIGAVRDVVDQLVAMQWLARQRGQIALAVSASRQAYRLAIDRYEAQVGSYLQVLAADLELLAQERIAATLATQALELDVNLKQGLGGGFARAPDDNSLRTTIVPSHD